MVNSCKCKKKAAITPSINIFWIRVITCLNNSKKICFIAAIAHSECDLILIEVRINSEINLEYDLNWVNIGLLLRSVTGITLYCSETEWTEMGHLSGKSGPSKTFTSSLTFTPQCCTIRTSIYPFSVTTYTSRNMQTQHREA